MDKRTFTTEEAKIIKEASEQGVQPILEKYNIFPASYSWKRSLKQWEPEGFAHGMTPINSSEFELEKENKTLKEIIIEKELEGKLKKTNC
jgi:putative transposase